MPKNLYVIQTTGGLTYYVEAGTSREAEQRARSPAVARAVVTTLMAELSNIKSVELHRGPAHTAHRKLVFDEQFFTQ